MDMIFIDNERNPSIVSLPLNVEAVQAECKVYDDVLEFPYEDPALFAMLECKIYDLAFDCGFGYPNPDNTTISLQIDLTADKFEPMLKLTVRPLLLTRDDLVDGVISVKEIENSIGFYETGYCQSSNEILCKIELTDREVRELQYEIIIHIQKLLPLSESIL